MKDNGLKQELVMRKSLFLAAKISSSVLHRDGGTTVSLSLFPFVKSNDKAESREVCDAGAPSPAWNPSVAFSANDSAS